MMGFFDLAIVYLAIGAPFAMSEFLQQREPLRAMRTVFLWPGVAWTIGSRRLSSRRGQGELFDIRTKRIGEKLRPTFAGQESMQFRQAFERYVGLSAEINRRSRGFESKSVELLKIAGRRTSAAAASALSRRNAVRLRRHHNDARARFLELIERSEDFDATMLALELATVLRDNEARKYLDRVVGHGRPEDDVWDTQEQQPSNKEIAA